ncbi:hypothetical protein PFISCL1PPCAC_13743, partial [Pristionchus fissidentatus]
SPLPLLSSLLRLLLLILLLFIVLAEEAARDPDWTPPTPTLHNLPKTEYCIVSVDSLLQLLSPCTSCTSGRNSLKFSEDALALSCIRECTSCEEKSTWSNSVVLPTANEAAKEKLMKVNVDVVVGSTVTAVGTTRLNYLLGSIGLNKVSKTSFHRLKEDYVLPAVVQEYTKMEEEVIERIKERLGKGGKLHIAGDGSFDTRGYSAEWCRYFLVDAETGEALSYVLMNKKDTGSSGTLEVACLERALEALAEKIGGVEHISTLVTDRHSAVIKMMKDRFPSINHYFDPWHYFRNLTLNLLKTQNRLFQNPEFTKFKKCIHSNSKLTNIPKNSREYKRLESVVFTEKNIEDIKAVSWLLKTSTCESLNALAWRYA